MKILLIQKMAGIAGSETYFLNLLPRLASIGVGAHFACVQAPRDTRKNEVFVRNLEEAGVKVHIINSSMSLSWRLISAIHRLIVEERYDIIQTNLIHADVWGAIIKQFFIKDLTLLSVKHGYSEGFQKRHGLNPLFVKPDAFSILTWWAGRYADRIVTISEGLKRFLVEARLVDPNRCRVIPYGLPFQGGGSAQDNAQPQTQVDAQMQAQAMHRFGRPQLVIVGRLVEVKQHRLVLEILPELVRRFPGVKLVVVGSGPLERDLKAYADARGVASHVVWEGFRKNVCDYLRASDVLVLPSAAEGFGMVILEAWQNKIPVIAFDVPAPNEIISDGETGVLVPPFDTAMLLEKVSSLLADPDLAKYIGERGEVQFRMRYTLTVMIESTIALYHEVLAHKRQVAA
jgi:glycosyltransferase involved in cell wall biosynthesis